MTWILVHQASFGPFFPEGTFSDSDDKFRAEFERTVTLAPDQHPDRTFLDFRSANRVNFGRPTAPARPFQMVDTFQLQRPVKELADILQTSNKLTAVSEAAKDIIERLEPGTHQFWPITFLTKRGEVANSTPYFAMLVLQSRDAMRPEASAEGSLKETASYSNRWRIQAHKKSLLEGIAIEEVAVNAAHLWFEQRAISGAYFLSDALSAALQERGLRLPPKFYKCTSV